MGERPPDFWPSKDACEPASVYRPDGNMPARSPLPEKHEFTRPCPWCRRPLSKRAAVDEFRCRTCGWRG